ncbi:hypothetical protein GH714_021162 [Hevea brasiliensis]|uniref:PGG domain-containing protein n=1 Tax=Hevea brasiliensis TaxID=3981 RepID=A0A6A6L3I4_HEVBR|nr:hypothetical protein GH714_021162 [Hevea brasiliensis]
MDESCSDHECVRYRPLCQAIVKEDLVAVESFLHHHPETIRIAFCRGWPALHLATITGNTKLVEKIVELMSEEDLEMVDGNKETALCLAAAIGATRIVELLIKKNKKLVTIPVDGCLPIANACHNGHRDTTWFLYSNTPFELLLPENGTFGAGLLCASLFTKMFGIQVQPTAAPSDVRITVVENGKMQQKNFLPQGLKQIYDMKLTRSYALELLQSISKEISAIPDLEIAKKGVDLAFFNAIEHGIIEIVIEIIKANPSFLECRYGFQKSTIHAAIRFRQEKEVESIVDPAFKQYVNEHGETPSQLFANSHKQLMEEAEKWIKGIAKSCSVVGALIITIMFTAAFTVPGGNIQDSGYPIFLHKKAFKVFVTADAISLFAASTSVLMFLGVLTSRYAEGDFLKSLPKKLIIGLSTLFFSIAAMMIAFCATLIIMLDGDLKLVIPTILLASVPVTVFIFLQFPLLVEIFESTYRPGMFDRKIKNLFQKDPISA